MWGTSKCKDCEYRDTEECGGKQILETGKNKWGITVGENGLEE